MAFVRLLTKASRLRNLKKQLVEEKADAIKVSKHLKTKKRFRHIGVDCRRKFKEFFKCRLSEKSRLHRTCYKLRHEGTCENYTLKSVLGFIGGVLLTYLFFIFCVFSLNFKLTSATIFCSFLGCILTIGLAFSTTIRCIVLLTLPQFFSKKGRQALLAYAFILVISGPAKNTLNNLGILSESLACGQEQLKQAVRQIIDVIKKPFLAIRDAIKKVVKAVKEVIKKIKEILLKIKRIIMAIVRVIKAAFEFLAKIINICNKELGTPFERCTRVFENAIADCHAKLGPIFNWLCSIAYIVKTVCYIVKIFDFVCLIVDFISDSVVGVVVRKVKTFIRHIRTMFYVRIKFSHSYEFQSTSSKSLAEISKNIVAEIKERTKTIKSVFDFMTSASTVFFLFMIFQVSYYRYKFLTSERFDNIYITKNFRDIDLRRAKLEKETVLPLNHREEQIYVQTSSGKLVQSEKKSLAKAAMNLASASVKIGAHLAADYCLFWMLNIISYYGRFQSKVKAPNFPTAHVSGNGFLADLLKSVVKAFQPVGIQLEIDTVPCLPIPIPPDYDRYVQIAVVLLFCWILTLFEPYGLRLRQKVMSYYHPTRSKERTIWLYNHIMRSRNSFLKFARRQLKRKMFDKKGIAKVTCKEYLRANLRCKIFRLCLGDDLQTACLLCGEVFRESDKEKPIRCQTPNCPGVYCEKCFSDLQNICTVCLSPIDYGDLSDIDEEKDSSEDEVKPIPKKKKKRCWRWKKEKKSSDEDDDDDKDDHSSSSKPLSTPQTYDESESDSDYHSSATSTDYSYSYQYDQDETLKRTETATSYKDVEKQDIPDYASMESFREEIVEEIMPLRELESDSSTDYDQYEESPLIEIDVDVSKLKRSKGTSTDFKISVGTEISGTALKETLERCSDIAISASIQTEKIESTETARAGSNKKGRSIPKAVVEFFGIPSRKKYYLDKNNEEEIPLLAEAVLGFPEDSYDAKNPFLPTKRVEFIGVPNADNFADSNRNSEHYSESSFITIPKSTMSTNTTDYCGLHFLDLPNEVDISSSLHTESIEELAKTGSVVPKLDISGINNEPPKSHNNDISEMFTHVKCEEISETPKTSSSTRSLASSSILSSLQENKEQQDSSNSKAQNVSFKTSNPFDSDSSSNTDVYDLENKQRKKVRDYYKTTKQLAFPEKKDQTPPKKKSKIMKFFKKIFFVERKCGSTNLPQATDTEEVVELTSYNYVNDQWDTYSASTGSPTYPFGQNTPQTASVEDSDQSESLHRIRGGECLPFDLRTNPRRLHCGIATSLNFPRFSLPPISETDIAHDWINKYFISVEDLTPTKDPGLQMQSSPTLDENISNDSQNQAAAPQEVPERDSSDIQLHHTVKSSHLNIDRAPSSASSVLSDSVCAAILGKPCPGRLKHRRSSNTVSSTTTQSTSGTQVSKEHSVDNESPPESPESSVQQTKSILRRTSLQKSNDSDPPTLAEKNGTNGNPPIDSASQVKPERLSNGSTRRLSIDRSDPENARIEAPKPTKAPEKVEGVTELVDSLAPSTKEPIDQEDPSAKFDHATRSPRQSEEQDLTSGFQTAVSDSVPQQGESTTVRLSDTQPQEIVYVKQGARLIQKGSSPILKVQVSINGTADKEGMAESYCTCTRKSDERIPHQRSVDKTVVTRESFPLRPSWSQALGGKTKTLLTSDKIQQTSDNDFYHAANNTISFTTELDTRSSAAMRKSSAMDQTQPTSSGNQMCKCPYSEQESTSTNRCIHSCCKCPPPLPPYDTSRERSYRSHSPPGNEMSDYEPTTPREYSSYGQSQPSPRSEYVPYEMRAVPSPPQPYRDFVDMPQPPVPRQPPRMFSQPPPRHYPRRPSGDSRWPTRELCSCNGECRCCTHCASKAPPVRQPARYVENWKYPEYSTTSYATTNLGQEDPSYGFTSSNQTDLPYQNNEEYLELVQELEETLHSRNRNRVRRAMEEFENRSRHNRPLDKPIIDYDETSESEEPIIEKINKFRTEKRMCCAGDQCSCRFKEQQGRRKESKKRGEPPKNYGSGCCRWQMDPGSGEWIKVPSGNSRRMKGPRGRSPSSHDCNCECKYCYQ